MGKLITVVGNSGVGKTTLARALCKAMKELTPALEQHTERPFHHLFARDLPRYALANQIDYLVYRAEQEQQLRQYAAVSIVDGGLDLDFYAFATLFYQKGYLTDREFALCQREYKLLRRLLPPPDLIIYLTAPVDIIKSRFERRGRDVEITQQNDLLALSRLIDEWVSSMQATQTTPILQIDTAHEDYCSEERLPKLVAEVRRHVT